MLSIHMRNAFFDRAKVQAAMDRARLKSLSRGGAFIRTRARSLLRRRKKPSAPGSPPSVHAASGDMASLKTILFAYDRSIDGVVVGPVKLNQVNETSTNVRTTVPGLHERGETASILESRWVPSVGQPYPWRRVDRRRQQRPGTSWGRTESRRRTARYPKRPFIGPALQMERNKIPDLFRNSIVKN